MNAAILGFVSAIAVMIGLIALDAKVTNWLIPEATDTSRVEFDVSMVESRLSQLSDELMRVDDRVDATDIRSQEAVALASSHSHDNCGFAILDFTNALNAMFAGNRQAEVEPGPLRLVAPDPLSIKFIDELNGMIEDCK